MFYYKSLDSVGQYRELGSKQWIHLNKHVINVFVCIYFLSLILSLYCHHIFGEAFTAFLSGLHVVPFVMASCYNFVVAILSNKNVNYVWMEVFLGVILFPLKISKLMVIKRSGNVKMDGVAQSDYY